MSPSGLAKLAGLDPTTFNKSKRGAANGKLRWPSTESLAKVLAATGASLEDFVALVDGDRRAVRARMVPLIGMAQAGSSGYFDDAGFPAGSGWEEIAFPEIADAHCYALEITGDSMLPVYRDGDRILVSPSGSLAARRPGGGQDPCRRSDGQAAWPHDGPAHRAQKLQSGFRGPQFRAERNRLRASHHLGQPVSAAGRATRMYRQRAVFQPCFARAEQRRLRARRGFETANAVVAGLDAGNLADGDLDLLQSGLVTSAPLLVRRTRP